MRRKTIFLTIVFMIVCMLLIMGILSSFLRNMPGQSRPTVVALEPPVTVTVPATLYKTHILGGFNIGMPDQAENAATLGVQVSFTYNQPPAPDDLLGKKLQALRLKVVDGYISSYLQYYECHRTWTSKPPILGNNPYCRSDSHPELIDDNALLTNIEQHLRRVSNNPLIIGYWVLDDWPSWDAGSARTLLARIHTLIERYTPQRPAICGFGGFLDSNARYTTTWSDSTAANFSPQGCDMVGLYIYSPSLSHSYPDPTSSAFDWSMTTVLPAIFASLQRRGWDINKQPLLGIGQVFGGPRANSDRYWVMPTSRDIETQSRSFCEHGASGLVFYGWDDSGYRSDTRTPMNSAEIEAGIRKGINACVQHWQIHS